MQLFHIDHTIQNGTLIIIDEETVHQCKKVLRLQKGDLINVQSTLANTSTRHLVSIQELSTKIIGSIVETTTKIRPQTTKGMLIAMSNKRDKIELITQKLGEIGLHQIIFRPSERSVIKERNKTKALRLQKILKEATEQSRGRFVPEITFREHPEDLLENTNLIIFDKQENSSSLDKLNEAIARLNTENLKEETPTKREKMYGLIGPEGGLSPKDHDRFSKFSPHLHSLGDTILRTETAAIIGARIIKNAK